MQPLLSACEFFVLGIQEIDEPHGGNEEQNDQSPSSASSQQPNAGSGTYAYWKVNLLRSFIVIVTVMFVLVFAKTLDSLYAISGAIFGLLNVVLFPALCHLKLAAETPTQKFVDYSLIALALVLMVFLPVTIIGSW